MAGKINPQQQQQQLSTAKHRVKRCHGNKRLQRLRKQYRSKGINEQEVEILVKMHQAINLLRQNNLPIINNDDQDEDNKNSYGTNIKNDINNISMYLENQEHFNELQSTQENLIVSSTNQPLISLQSLTTGEWISPQTTKYQTSFKRYNLANDHWGQYSKLIPNYRNLSSNQFKDMLIKSIPMKDHSMIEQLLNNFPLLQSLQNRAELICTVSQLKIEQNYWKHVLNLLNTPIGIWLSEVSKTMLTESFINWDHTKTKINIECRQELLKSKLINAQNKLKIQLRQSDSWYWSTEIKSKPHLLNIIFKGLHVLIQNSLYYFRLNFEQKTILLKFDIIDVHLVKTFYDLIPNEEQIQTIRKIWQLSVKSCKRAVRQKKKKHTLPIKKLILTGTNIQFQSNKQLSSQSLTPTMRSICEHRLNNNEERTRNLMTFSSCIIDNAFFQNTN